MGSPPGSPRGSRHACQGCRKLRQKCKKDCVLVPCLKLSCGDKIKQGNVTAFLAKQIGRKRFIQLLQEVTGDERPDLVRSLLYERCGRILNPISGALGLQTSNRWDLCEAAVTNVMMGRSLSRVKVGTSTPSNSGGKSTGTSKGSSPLAMGKVKPEPGEGGDEKDGRPQVLTADSRVKSFDLNKCPID